MNDAPQPPQIPDELVNQVFSDPSARPAILQLLEHNKIDTPIEDLPMDMKRQIVNFMLSSAQQAQNAAPTPAPPEMVAQVLGDAEALARINTILKENDIDTAFEAMEPDAQAGILGQIVAQNQQAQAEGPRINVDLEGLKQTQEAFDKIWNDAQTEAGGDIAKFSSLMQGKLFAAGAPAGAISELIAQFPKAEGQT